MMINKKLIMIISAAIAGLVVCASTVVLVTREKTPDPSGQTREEIIAYRESEEFENLDPNSRRDYSRQAFMRVMREQVDGYFEIPVEHRTAYLDETIDQMQNIRSRIRQQMQTGGMSDPDRTSRRRKNFTSSKMRERSESIDPDTRARMSAFRQAMRQRMSQRNIQPSKR